MGWQPTTDCLPDNRCIIKNYYIGMKHTTSQFWTALVQLFRIGLAHKTHSCKCYSLMFIFYVDGDGLLSIYTARVYVLQLQSLPYLSGLLCCFTNDVIISLIQQFILVFELCKVLAMPNHRPHTPYVGVPKWERRNVLLWRLFMKPIITLRKSDSFSTRGRQV